MVHRLCFDELGGLKMSFCPKWVFEAACSAAAAEYLSRQLDLNTVAVAIRWYCLSSISPLTLKKWLA